MIEIFKDTNYDFLGKKWLFIGLSWLLILAGAVSIAWRALDGDPHTHPFNFGIDFTGGTLVNAKFKEKPDLDRLRAAIEQQGIEGSKITLQPIGEQVGQAPKHEVLIRLPNLLTVERQAGQSETAAKATTNADIGKQKILAAFAALSSLPVTQNKVDLNLVGRDRLKDELVRLDPLNLRAGGGAQSGELRYGDIAARIIDYREQERGGLIGSLHEINNLSGIEPQLGATLERHFFAGEAAVRSAAAVSPQVGADLRHRAVYVTLAACGGMLVYVALRFKSWGYGLGAVVAVFHDVLVTLGVFSIVRWEIELNVVAALLTLVGFSMNDTIVIFDRIRELRGRRREKLEKLANDAINETLSRTVITNGTTFLSILALVLFGGEVLKSFSWALFVGVIVGTYSTIYIASPFMLWWEGRKAKPYSPPAAGPATVGQTVNPSTAGAPVEWRGKSEGKGPRHSG